MRFTSQREDARMQRRQFLRTGSTSLMGLATLASPARAAVQELTWTDSARSRSLPLLMRWPDGDVPCALVLHSHGLGGSREGGDAWGRAWQQAGIAVLHVQHPGSDSEVLRGGQRALRQAVTYEQLAARVADMRFLLDEVLRRSRAAEPGFARVQVDAIGASGHSFGARTVQALAGQRFAAAAAAGLAELRFKAFVALSPAPGRDGPSPERAFGAVTRPFLCITGSQDQNPLGSERTGDHRLAVYEGLPSGQRALLWLDGADHMTFGGNALQRIGARRGLFHRDPAVAEREPAQHTLVAEVTSLWWRSRLLGDPAATAALRAPPGLGPGDRWRAD
jgi:predicted dienelactone hydrolase